MAANPFKVLADLQVSGSAAFKNGADMQSQKIVNVATGTATTDAVNYGQLSAETSRAQSVEAAQSGAVSSEASRAASAEASLSSAVSAEASRAGSAEVSLSGAVSSEEARATSAETSLSGAISSEEARATSAETSLSGTISSEASRATSAESSLSSGISSEQSRAQSAETSLSGAVSSEASRAGSAEASLSGGISSEASRATSAETSLSSGLSTEVSRAGSAEVSLSGAVSAEASRAGSAEASLSGALSTEVSRAGSAETSLSTALSGEVSRAQSVETSIATNFLKLDGTSTMTGELKMGNQDIVNANSGTFNGDLLVKGNLNVSGSLTYLNTSNLDIQDAKVTIAKGAADLAAAADAGIYVGSDSAALAQIKVTSGGEWVASGSAGFAIAATSSADIAPGVSIVDGKFNVEKTLRDFAVAFGGMSNTQSSRYAAARVAQEIAINPSGEGSFTFSTAPFANAEIGYIAVDVLVKDSNNLYTNDLVSVHLKTGGTYCTVEITAPAAANGTVRLVAVNESWGLSG
jgi:Coiled stalk of trimeric autotransporter adhesin